MNLRVMVTGAGSGVGQGIAKALRASTLPVTIIFADIDSFNPGFFRCDEAVLIPRVENNDSLEAMIDIIRGARIDVVMIGSVFDLVFFSRNAQIIEKETGAKVLVSPPEVLAIGLDKWLTVEFLRTAGLPHPQSKIPSSVDDASATARIWGYPIVLKGRKGRASREVHVVRSDDALRSTYPLVRDPILQQLIAEPHDSLDAEYTCGIVKGADGCVLGPATIRRSLRDGHSWVMESDQFDFLRPVLLEIGRRLPILGPMNVQLIVAGGVPFPFEFNPRFSGTTPIRAHFGFNEPELALRNIVLGEKVKNPLLRRGMAFRYHEEVFVDDLSSSALSSKNGAFPRGVIHGWF
jgi:carbamoyl-phosphate synthase large subunit